MLTQYFAVFLVTVRTLEIRSKIFKKLEMSCKKEEIPDVTKIPNLPNV